MLQSSKLSRVDFLSCDNGYIEMILHFWKWLKLSRNYSKWWNWTQISMQFWSEWCILTFVYVLFCLKFLCSCPSKSNMKPKKEISGIWRKYLLANSAFLLPIFWYLWFSVFYFSTLVRIVCKIILKSHSFIDFDIYHDLL